MNVALLETLAPGDAQDLEEHHRRVGGVSHEQWPRYLAAVPPRDPVRWLLGRRDGQVVAAAAVHERARVLARVRFGPSFETADDGAELLLAAHRRYRDRGFLALEVQPGEPQGPRGEALCFALARHVTVTTPFDEAVWTTATVALHGTAEARERGFSEGHRRNLAKARRSGLTTAPLSAPADLGELAASHAAMYRHRGLAVDEAATARHLKDLTTYFQSGGPGFVLGVRDGDQRLLGGVAIVGEGQRAVYTLGASHPHRREAPVLHLALADSMTHAQAGGATVFDLGGYAAMAAPDSPMAQLNRFKDGFRPRHEYVTRRFVLELRPVPLRVYRLLDRMRREIRDRRWTGTL